MFRSETIDVQQGEQTIGGKAVDNLVDKCVEKRGITNEGRKASGYSPSYHEFFQHFSTVFCKKKI
jgi:hypothetical protein